MKKATSRIKKNARKTKRIMGGGIIDRIRSFSSGSKGSKGSKTSTKAKSMITSSAEKRRDMVSDLSVKINEVEEQMKTNGVTRILIDKLVSLNELRDREYRKMYAVAIKPKGISNLSSIKE